MSTALAEPLLRASISTFEELAFLYVTPTTAPVGGPPEAEAAIAFRGPRNGCLVVRTFGGVLPALAANMLGEAEPPTAELQRDALAEVANCICGLLLPLIAGPLALFRFEVPHRRERPRPERPPLDAVRLEIGPGGAEVLLYLSDPGSEAS